MRPKLLVLVGKNIKTSEEVIKKQKRSVRKPWFNTEYEEAIKRINEARLKWLADITNEPNRVRYSTRMREVCNICRGGKGNI